jgi:CheY-like chemotaxis protein
MTPQHTILFVDDDKDFLAAQTAFFQAHGYTVLTAYDPAEALALLETQTPDIIFLDLMMEHVDDGFRLGYEIRKRDHLKDVPLVMLSGVAAATGQRFDAEAGGLQEWSRLDQFLDKPVTGRQLLRVVEERLGGGRAA